MGLQGTYTSDTLGDLTNSYLNYEIFNIHKDSKAIINVRNYISKAKRDENINSNFNSFTVIVDKGMDESAFNALLVGNIEDAIYAHLKTLPDYSGWSDVIE